MIAAAEKGDYEKVRDLVLDGADPNARDNFSGSAMM